MHRRFFNRPIDHVASCVDREISYSGGSVVCYVRRWLHSCISVLGLLLAVFATSSCQKSGLVEEVDVRNPQGELELNIRGTINQEYETRVNDNGFADGDKMGIYIVDCPGSLSDSKHRASNLLYTYNSESNEWESPALIYWKDASTPIDVYGYYPGVEYIANPTEYDYEVSYRQDIIPTDGTMSNYEASDFLWGKVEEVAPTEDVITVNYAHRMAGVKVQLMEGSGFDSGEWDGLVKSVMVDNTVRYATIDISDGVPAPVGEVDKSIIMMPQSNDIFRAVVVPQSVAAGQSLISITIDGITYRHRLDAEMMYNLGQLHQFTITVNRRSSGDYEYSVESGIVNWENDEVTHKYDSSSYVVIDVPEAGMLEQVVTELGIDPKLIENLKLCGTLTDADFDYIHATMEKTIRSINLRDVKFENVYVNNEWIDGGGWKNYFSDDYLPNNAFRYMDNLRSVVLPMNIKEIGDSSFRDLRLSSPIILPEGVLKIHAYAFWGCDAEIVMPHTLEYVGGSAFHSERLRGELILTDNLTHIEGGAFDSAGGLYGTFYMPQKVEFVGENAFCGLGNNLVGDIVIPQSMTEIPGGAFRLNFAPSGTNLILHDGVVSIGDSAFANTRIKNIIDWPEGLLFIEKNAFLNVNMVNGNFQFPPNIKKIVNGAFRFNRIGGELVLPESMTSIDAVFNFTDITSVVIGDTYTFVGDEAFSSNGRLERVYLGKNVEYIGSGAFSDHSIKTIICMAKEPPMVRDNTFNVQFDKCVLQVPESSVEIYRNTAVWSQFRNITAYKELAFNIPSIVTLDKGVVRTGILRAEGEWEVSECPDWVTVSPMSGAHKTELTITVDAQSVGAQTREGRIVFSLKGKDYTTYTDVRQVGGSTYGEDERVILQTATKGSKAVPLFLIGDGYCAEDIVSGKYLEDMKQQMEYFFSIEPLKSYRDYFTVSTAYAVSPEPFGGLTRFNEDDPGTIRGVSDWVVDYARKYGEGVAGNEHNTTILVLMNTSVTANYSDLFDSGLAISWMGKSEDQYPYDQQGFILHELAGKAFGKLGPESVTHYTFNEACGCPGCNMNGEYNRAKQNGWWENITKTNKLTKLPWYHLIFHEKYVSMVDIYEGGCGHARGVYRSENVSVMGGAYVHYFNTISREVLVRRIMECAGEEYSFEEFVALDKIELPSQLN